MCNVLTPVWAGAWTGGLGGGRFQSCCTFPVSTGAGRRRKTERGKAQVSTGAGSGGKSSRRRHALNGSLRLGKARSRPARQVPLSNPVLPLPTSQKCGWGTREVGSFESKLSRSGKPENLTATVQGGSFSCSYCGTPVVSTSYKSAEEGLLRRGPTILATRLTCVVAGCAGRRGIGPEKSPRSAARQCGVAAASRQPSSDG